MNCHRCAGYGLAKSDKREDRMYAVCGVCHGTGQAPRDPWVRPVLIFAALIALYFAWQFMR